LETLIFKLQTRLRTIRAMTKLFDLSGEVAVVIGATGVLGGKVAEGLAQAGAKVAVLGRNAERGQGCVQRIQKEKGDAKFFSADAISRESLKKAGAEIEKAFGPPTVLVNAAGGNDPKVTVTDQFKFEQITLDDWRANFDTNLVGGMLLPCQEFGPGMAARGKGSIINFASVCAPAAFARRRLFRGQGGGFEPDPVFGPRMGGAPGPRQLHHAWLFSRRTKSPSALQGGRHAHRPGAQHPGAHAHGPVRATGGTGGSGCFSSQCTRQQLRHRNGFVRGRRLPGADHLRTSLKVCIRPDVTSFRTPPGRAAEIQR